MWFLLILSVQVIAITIVVLVLRYLLEGMLIESALRSFEYFAKKNDKPFVRSLTVISARPLRPKDEERVRKAMPLLVLPDAKKTIQVQPEIWGGLIIKADDKEWDSSLRLRLRQAFSQR